MNISWTNRNLKRLVYMEIVEAELAQFVQECSNFASYNSWIIWNSIIYNIHKSVYCENYKDAFEMFNILEKASIQEIEEISFVKMNEEYFEKITDQLLNYKINTLRYDEFGSWESIK